MLIVHNLRWDANPRVCSLLSVSMDGRCLRSLSLFWSKRPYCTATHSVCQVLTVILFIRHFMGECNSQGLSTNFRHLVLEQLELHSDLCQTQSSCTYIQTIFNTPYTDPQSPDRSTWLMGIIKEYTWCHITMPRCSSLHSRRYFALTMTRLYCVAILLTKV